MTVDVEIRGQRRTVTARRVGTAWVVSIDGRSYAIDATRIAERWSLLVSPVRENSSDPQVRLASPARSYEVAIEALRPAGAVAHIDGSRIPLTVISAQAAVATRRRQVPPSGASGRQSIVAPMPGRVIKVLVERGDSVSARQGLIVVEAMKMENELRAPRSGTVAEVRVAEGATVEANAVLIVLE